MSDISVCTVKILLLLVLTALREHMLYVHVQQACFVHAS